VYLQPKIPNSKKKRGIRITHPPFSLFLFPPPHGYEREREKGTRMQNLKIYIGIREGGFQEHMQSFLFRKSTQILHHQTSFCLLRWRFFSYPWLWCSPREKRGGNRAVERKIAVVGERRKPRIIIITVTTVERRIVVY